MKYTVFSDGAARGNPTGPAGAGYAVFNEDGEMVHSHAMPLGRTSNNVAEYTALLEAAKYVRTLDPEYVEFKLDSELVVKQIAGVYKVKAEHLIPLYQELKAVLKGIKCKCMHIPREQNKVADKLANEGADLV
ncbi:MAG: ribonuclease HI family protein [Deferribacteraceae bacterium]|nr:ribonuclease HI family protein [Deferribacteraceae bacterium]